jgi:hypothetical protein
MSSDTARPAGSARGTAVTAAPVPARDPVPAPEQVPARDPVPAPEQVPARDPVLPEQSREDTDAGWGEYPEPAGDRLYRDRPPHWDDF